MARKFILVTFSLVILASMLLVSCTTEETAAPQETSPPQQTETGTTTPAATVKPLPTTGGGTEAPPGTETGADWWDKWGEPVYGGTMVMRAGEIELYTDPQDPRTSQYGMWLETLFGDDMTLDREIHAFNTAFKPSEYFQGWIAEGWEQLDPLTYEVKLKQGVYWHDKYPTYGREFNAYDVEYSYDRMLGIGEFDTPNAFFSGYLAHIDKVAATGDYTVEFRMKSASPLNIFEVVGPYMAVGMVPREWDELSDDEKTDWQNAVGTGAYILSNYVSGTSLTGSRNPNYWGTDERHPGNPLPYLDEFKYLSIPDMATAIAALRTGRIDILSDSRNYPSIAQMETIVESIPDINMTWWLTWGPNIIFKGDAEPFTDIRVRQAFQMAIPRQIIAETYYKGYTSGNPVGLLQPQIGESWVIPYEEWPDDLKAQYEYDPEAARQLLAEADLPNGFSTNIIAATQDDITLLEIMQSYLAEINIDMKIEAMDRTSHRAMANGLLYDALIYEQGMGQATVPGTALASWWSGNPERGRWGQIYDPGFDAIVENYYAATTLEDAQKYFKEADMYALSQHWAVGACLVPSPQFWQSWVKGWSGESFWSMWSRMYHARMWIDKE